GISTTALHDAGAMIVRPCGSRDSVVECGDERSGAAPLWADVGCLWAGAGRAQVGGGFETPGDVFREPSVSSGRSTAVSPMPGWAWHLDHRTPRRWREGRGLT
ncbi:MAG: hypothetical protein V4662_15615, partial [Verrucomicrobiota bacterium]